MNRRRHNRDRCWLRSISMCQVSFSEPSLLRRWRERKVATAGLSRERPVAGADRRRGWLQRRRSRRRKCCAVDLGIELLEHAGRFFASRHAKVQPLLRLCGLARSHSLCNCSRTGRNPAAPSPPSSAAATAGRRRASCAPASGMAGSCHGSAIVSAVIYLLGVPQERPRRRSSPAKSVPASGSWRAA